MRKAIPIVTMAIISLMGMHLTSDDAGLAHVRKIDGLDIYMYAEPLADYEEVFRVSGFWNWGEVMEDRANLDNIVNTMVRNAKRKNKKAYQSGDDKADAIIIYNNDRAIGIKYLD